MNTIHDPTVLPADLPAPQDDGAARHLDGLTLPSLALPATDGGEVDLARLPGRAVVYIYPRTGRPGQPLPDGWDAIPGARGCTPQSCSFRDQFAELRALGVSHLYGMSTQDSDYQREAVERLHLPFAILSDAGLRFTRALRLPTFVVDGMTLQKRMVLVIDDGVVTKVFYPGVSARSERRRRRRMAARVEIGAHRRREASPSCAGKHADRPAQFFWKSATRVTALLGIGNV